MPSPDALSQCGIDLTYFFPIGPYRRVSSFCSLPFLLVLVKLHFMLPQADTSEIMISLFLQVQALALLCIH